MPAAISISDAEDAAFSDTAHQKLIACLRRTPLLGRACVFVLRLSAFVHAGPCNFNVFSFAATAPRVISSNGGTSLFLAESCDKPAAPYTYSTLNCRQRQEPAGGHHSKKKKKKNGANSTNRSGSCVNKTLTHRGELQHISYPIKYYTARYVL